MKNLLVLRETLKSFYSKNEIYATPILKFLLAFIALTLINSNLGYMGKIDNLPIVLIIALLCSFLPYNLMLFFTAVFVILHTYALSLECAIVVTVLFLLLFLLYFRFTPKDTLAILLTPLCFLFHIPYIIPIAVGLIGTPLSMISVVGGVVVYYTISYINQNVSAINSLDAESAIQKLRYIIDGLLNNKEMLMTVIAFSITIVLVYLIRRLSVDHSWTIAMLAGVIVNILVLLIGDFMFDTNISIIGCIFGNLVAFFMALVLQFFVFNVDYSRTEHVQYEDDEYYYYVKAIPKVIVSKPKKKVQKMNTSQNWEEDEEL